MKPVSGFSKMNKHEKIELLTNQLFGGNTASVRELIQSFWHSACHFSHRIAAEEKGDQLQHNIDLAHEILFVKTRALRLKCS